ncbi:hypothetical protein AOLI_G00074050 [Acnodon oligacanthus]
MQLNRPRSALLGYAESHASFSSQFKTMRFSYHISGGLPSPQPALRRRVFNAQSRTQKGGSFFVVILLTLSKRQSRMYLI